MTKSLIDYKIATSPALPPLSAVMKEYWLASNGVFVRAKRQGLYGCIPIALCNIPGLTAVDPNVQMEYPRVSASIISTMLSAAQAVGKKEILFYLSFVDSNWQLDIPEQVASPTSVKPLLASLGSAYETALIEVHSHHFMNAQFSLTDDLEESGKFRIFAVMGEIFTRPTINVRVGIYSHFWQIPAAWVFEMPHELNDSFALCN